MKYFAVLIEQDVPEGEMGINASFKISTDSETEANAKLNIIIGWYPDKTFKKYIHYCGNTSDGENAPCIMREIS
jgi:hypothetical protein